jgi:predicted RNA-binding Zn-ribbon protein involved in translation (DUF1610 family)
MKILKQTENSNEWIESNEDEFYTSVDITKDIIEELKIEDRNPELYTRKNAMNILKSGKIVDTPCLLFKLGKDADTKKCPKCGSYYIGIGALSRRDNKTDICSDCGEQEGLEDMKKYFENKRNA